MTRLPYYVALCTVARRADIDAPRTPYAASRERQQLGIATLVLRGRVRIVRTLRGEALPIVANQLRRFS
jgi:hypothetical protein